VLFIIEEFSCIVLAGGLGVRFGSPKQYALLNGKEVWTYAYDQCCSVSREVIVVGRDVPAGKTRQASVRNGLALVTNNVVVIVEAARPLVTSAQIKAIAEKVSEEHPSWAYSLPCNYTIFDSYTGTHLNRDTLWYVQVPQAFWAPYLKTAHKYGMGSYTSDTQMMQQIWGYPPQFLQGGINLHKITYREDLKMLEGLL
jgi:2-C-methyl-D-erythritol 4-phosphate cytidylyltransferase